MGFNFGNAINAVSHRETHDCLTKLGAVVRALDGTVSTLKRDGETVQSHADLTDLDYASSGHTGFASSASLSSKINGTGTIGYVPLWTAADTQGDSGYAWDAGGGTPFGSVAASQWGVYAASGNPVFHVGTDTSHAMKITRDAGSGLVTITTESGSPTGSFAFGRAVAVTGALSATGAVTGSNLSGTNTGDQTITLTGEVMGSGTGSFATAIDRTIAPTMSGAWVFTNAAGIDLATVGIIQTSVANSGTNVGCTVRNSVSLTGARRMFQVNWWTGAAYQEAFGVFSKAANAKEMRLLYDASNYFAISVASVGSVTINAVGTTGSLGFAAVTDVVFTATAGSVTFTPSTFTKFNGTSIVMNDGMVISNSANTTGLKIGAAADKLGFFSVTPVVRPSAFTQTYSTASHTHPNMPTNAVALTDSTTGTAAGTLVDVGVLFNQGNINSNFASLARQTADIITAITDLKAVVNGVIDDGQSLGLLQ